MTTSQIDQILLQRENAGTQIIDVEEPTVKLVIFALGSAWFAFHGHAICEILTQTTVYFVPGCPPALEGVMNVRGDIESVIHLHTLLHGSAPANVASQTRTAASSILLGQGAGIRSGMRVDSVVDVVDLPASTIQPAPPALEGATRHWVTGVLCFKDRPVSVIDLALLFADFAGSID
jgi:purine-binding chemotaxis protein CheW